jgi:hypothetical protein
MTRKDYIKLAEAFRLANNNLTQQLKEGKTLKPIDGFSTALEYITEALKLDNNRFNQEKFLDAVFK